jgi:hypothetical protein
MGSEFAYEDLSSFELEKFKFTYLRDEAIDNLPAFVVEQTPTDEFSGYSKTIAWIDQKDYKVLKVEYYDKNGNLQENEFHGLTSRIFQHSYDHLQGISIKDKVSKLKWDLAVKRLNNYKQKLVKKYTQKKLLEIKKAMEEETNANS